MLNEGFYSKLKVTIPPVTIPSWPCLFSGLNPEQLGYYWFDHPKKGLFNSSIWRDRAIFSLIDTKKFVLNVPGTYPAWNVDGEMITGMMSPRISCFPAELKFFIEKNWIINGKTVLECFKAFEMKKKLFLRKLKEDFDLLIYVIRLPDSLSHHTHLSRDHVFHYINLGYQKIDEFLGMLLKEKDIQNFFIFSDHGLKDFNYEFNVNRWLEKNGLLLINKSKSKKLYSLVAKFYDIIRPFVKLDYKKYFKAKKSILRNIIDDNISTQENLEKTRLLKFFGNTGGLFLVGKDKLKKNIIKTELEKDKRIKKIITTEKKGFPDLFIVLEDKYLFNHDASLFLLRRRNSINHSQTGFFIAYGKNIKKGFLDFIDYTQIAPTILKLYGINKMNYMEGDPLNILK